ncbi:hypothetical protein SH1V18_37400 [Vallitalea longa]|uniref:Uncharacterized protein n=1 Tax=Vallitalea longa TaxID=2936439 RepID=A0A9W6DG53_9FIRM|nr:hypothetical protein [Vallitalea longa]GKX31260.1 hypothetical protein SH1V18_37400 [Vallitalea longa]
MLTFSNSRRIRRYPKSSIIHLPISEYIFNVYNPFSYTNDFINSCSSTISNSRRRNVGR